MALQIVHIGEPADSFYSDVFLPVFIYTVTGSFQRVVVRNTEFAVTAVDAGSEPNLPLHHQREDFLV